MERISKKCLFMGIFFSLLAITFFLLYHFKVIKTLDLMLTVTYILYFIGLALIYNGAYNREFDRTKSTAISFGIGCLAILCALVLLIYGLITGQIMLW